MYIYSRVIPRWSWRSLVSNVLDLRCFASWQEAVTTLSIKSSAIPMSSCTGGKKKHTIHAMETHLVGCYAIKVSHFLHIFVQDLLRVHFWYQVYQFLLTQHLPSRLRLTCNRIKETRLFFFPHPSIALLPFSSQKHSKAYGKTYLPSCWPLTANKRWLSYFCKRWLSSILAPLPQDGGFCNCQGHFWTR